MENYSNPDLVQSILDDLEIDSNELVYITLTNGVELIGELSKENVSVHSLIIKNPMKVLYQYQITNSETTNSIFLIPWTPFHDMESPHIILTRSNIITACIPGKKTIEAYLFALHDMYYPIIDFQIDNFDSDQVNNFNESESNVIDIFNYLPFSKYHT